MTKHDYPITARPKNGTELDGAKVEEPEVEVKQRESKGTAPEQWRCGPDERWAEVEPERLGAYVKRQVAMTTEGRGSGHLSPPNSRNISGVYQGDIRLAHAQAWPDTGCLLVSGFQKCCLDFVRAHQEHTVQAPISPLYLDLPYA